MKFSKNMYLATFSAMVLILAVVRCVCPAVTGDDDAAATGAGPTAADDTATTTGVGERTTGDDSSAPDRKRSRFFDGDGQPVRHRIYSVSSYAEAFPDSNDLQMTAAKRLGVQPVENRDEAATHRESLVYIGASPYYHVDRLNRSIPYLVPQAAVLLNDIGRAYYDSLQIKGYPLYQFIVTSVTRTKEDVRKLRNYNHNATENSCHLYGTTFDICYNRYEPVVDPDDPQTQWTGSDKLKWILCEVLSDMRKNGRCYVKYEYKQSCFHITVR